MRIALVTNLIHDQLGLFYISSALKKAGHNVRYFFGDRNLEKNLRRFSPQLVGFSALTGNHLWAQECAVAVKEFLPGVKTILGGAHATYYPEIINHHGLDFICRGEGERAIVEICDAIERGNDFMNIRGIWAKEGDKIYKNDFANLAENLDYIPFPDRSIYNLSTFYGFYTYYPFVISSRGCPYNCTFCFEPVFKEFMKGKGKYVRFRSVENVIDEVLEIKKNYKIRSIEFVDDIFGMKCDWLREFALLWRKEVNLPFQCNLRTDLITEELGDLLKQAGCSSVAIGVESGSTRIRNVLLHKELSDESIVRAAEILHKRGIKIITYNIIGIPGETIDEAWETVHINQKIGADFSSVALMQPYPGTKIHELAVNGGYFSTSENIDKFPCSFHDITPLKIPMLNRFINLQKLFNLPVWFPKTERVVKQLIKIPVNPVFYLLFLSIHTYGLWIKIKKIPPIYLFQVLFNIIKNLIKHRMIIKTNGMRVK